MVERLPDNPLLAHEQAAAKEALAIVIERQRLAEAACLAYEAFLDAGIGTAASQTTWHAFQDAYRAWTVAAGREIVYGYPTNADRVLR